MSKRGSLIYQVNKRFSDMFAFGESKHQFKRSGEASAGIFSFNTAKTYIREACTFAQWVKAHHKGIREIDDCKPYIREYLSKARKRNGGKYSAYSLATKAAAIAKLYGADKVKTPERTRRGITRSRNTKPGEFEKMHPEIVKFCDCTGLRRNELETLRGNQLIYRDGRPCISIQGNQAKGGKPRTVPIIREPDFIVCMMEKAGTEKVFGRVSKSFDIHSHRAKYAAELYKQNVRPLSVCLREPFFDAERGKLRKNSVYYCRIDQAGKWYDRAAMLTVSRALGHNRISVIAGHYLYNVGT